MITSLSLASPSHRAVWVLMKNIINFQCIKLKSIKTKNYYLIVYCFLFTYIYTNILNALTEIPISNDTSSLCYPNQKRNYLSYNILKDHMVLHQNKNIIEIDFINSDNSFEKRPKSPPIKRPALPNQEKNISNT